MIIVDRDIGLFAVVKIQNFSFGTSDNNTTL